MKRKAETWIIILLPLLILGMLVFSARIMSAHYMILNGFDQAAKIYGEQFTVARKKLDCMPGKALSINVTVKNTGNFIWPSAGSNPVHMSCHILDANKKPVINDGLRADLPKDLLPGQQVTVPLQVKAPEQLGSYIVQLDMVQEGVTWFGEKGGETYSVRLEEK
ncbi:MAG: COG1470 family protein [Desulfitobacteriaceae bacterium]